MINYDIADVRLSEPVHVRFLATQGHAAPVTPLGALVEITETVALLTGARVARITYPDECVQPDNLKSSANARSHYLHKIPHI